MANQKKISAPAPVVRPPWPDELPRLTDAFPGLALNQPLHLRVLALPATATSPERLVGLAALAAPSPGKTDAPLFFAVRPRFAPTPPATELLNEILALARAHDFPAVIAPVADEASTRATLLRTAGFQPAAEAKILRLALK